LPVVIAATRKGEIEKSSFAGYLDNLRLRSGLKQLFGTQTTIMDGFLVLFPIANESLVDDRRKQFDLPPLADYLRLLEYRYNLPLIRAPGKLANKFVEDSQNPIAKATTLFEGEELEENEVVRISSDLVSINVSVYDQRLRTHVGRLTREDFTVLEDGQPQTISFFASTDVPFDLVLLIDLSGSTVGKRDLIRKSTRRFVEAARPSDRVAIVTFWDTTDVISPLTANHQELLEKIANIKGTGGSHVWDALKFTLDQVLGPKSLERRRAIVFMTDGVDNAFMGYQPGGSVGSAITFSQLLDAVRRTDVLVIPIYLDTESDGGPPWQRWYANARKTLGLLAEESGAPFYQARKIEDLDGVYTQVLNDLGQVYSLGYKPTNTKHDGLWRSVAIKVANHPELTTRSRPGYDAK
jgi:VWFA-related protein